MSTNLKKRTLAALLGVLFLLLSLAGVWGVSLQKPSSGLLFNNTTSYNGIAKFYRGTSGLVSANWTENVTSDIQLNISNSNTDTIFVVSSTLSGDIKNQTYNESWTNYTIFFNTSWSLGRHNITINVSNTTNKNIDLTSENITLFGELNTTFTEPASNSTQHTGDTVTLNSTVRMVDNGTAVSGINVSFYNSTGNYIDSNVSDSSGIAYIKYQIPSNQTGYYNYTANVTNTTTYTDPSLNDTLSIYQYGWSEVNQSFSTYPAYRTAENTTVKVKITDNLTADGVGNYPVEFYLNDTDSFTLNATRQTNSSGWANYTFNISTEGVYNVTFNITDNSTVYYNSSSDYQDSLLVIVNNPSIYSTNHNFSATPALVPFNWTAGNLTLKSYVDTLKLNIDNESTEIYPDYSQNSVDYENLNFYTYTSSICFNPGLPFTVKNQTKNSTSSTSTLGMSNSEWFTLEPLYSCPPGKYSGNFTVKQVSNSNENLAVNTTVHIPINSQNTLNTASRNASFLTRFEYNASEYHSFYFNTSAIENTTGATFTLEGFSSDFDLFVFDENKNLVGKSINKDSSDEKIRFADLPPSPEMWEIRVFGNNTTSSEGLRGDFYFTVLNSTKSSVDFGKLNVSGNSSKTFTLKNEYNDILSNVKEYKEIYKVKSWTNKNTSKDHQFIVPSFAQKVKVSVNWTQESGENVTDWNLFLTDPDNNVAGNSTDKYINANVTDAPREEFVIYSESVDSSNEGYWNISVRNQTKAPLNNYTVQAKIWLDESKWITTNYTDGGFDFNRTNETVNSTYPLEVNLSVPTDSMYGSYEGNLIYNNTQGWNYEISFSADVNSSVLLVEDSVKEVSKEVGKDNIGFDRTGDNAKEANLTIKNEGNYDLTWVNSTSGILKEDADSNISLDIEWPSEPIPPGGSAVLNISAPINTDLTHNDDGIYKGWIFLNTTNQTNPSYPYETFNATLTVNLTDRLNVEIYGIDTSDGDNWHNASIPENVTYWTRVYLINGTEIGDETYTGDENVGELHSLGISNFTSAWMNETNVTSKGYNLTSIKQLDPTSPDDLCYNNYCYVNASVPSGVAGGRYRMSMKVEWNGSASESLLTGTGGWESLVVNDPGLYFNSTHPSDGTLDLNQLTDDKVNITVTNYGPVDSSEDINLTGCGSYIKNVDSGGACDANSYGDRSIQSPTVPANGSSCWMKWSFTTKNVSQDRSCSFGFDTGAPKLNDLSVSLDITDTDGGGDGDDTDGGDTTTQQVVSCNTSDWTNQTCGEGSCSATQMNQTRSVSPSGCANSSRCIDALAACGSYGLSVSLDPDSIEIVQGESGSVTVSAENTGDIDLEDLELFVSGEAPELWYNASTSTPDIDSGSTGNFTVNFSLSKNSTVGIYEMTYKVNNSKVSSSVDGDLMVEPTENKTEEINQTYQSLKQNVSEISERVGRILHTQENTSELNETYQSLLDKVKEVGTAINKGNYATAKEKIDDVKSLYNDLQKKVEKLEKEPNYLLWISVGIVVIVVASLLAYLLIPPKEGYHPEEGYQYQKTEKKGTVEKLKSEWKELVNKIKKKLGMERTNLYDYQGREKWKPEEE